MHSTTIQENDDERKDLCAANPAGNALKYAGAKGRGHNLSQYNKSKNDCQNQTHLVPIKVIHGAIRSRNPPSPLEFKRH